MRIAYLPGLFPVLSETPVVNQITGLVARGHEVTIFADRPTTASPYHESIDRFHLLERTHYRPAIPSRLGERWAGVPGLFRAHPEGRRVLRRALNPLVYAGRALSAKLAWQAVQYFPPGSYDIIHGGFGEQGVKALRMRRLGALQGPLVTAFRGADLTRYVRTRGPGVYRRLFREGSLFLPVSRHFADLLVAMGCPASRIQVLRTGISLSLYPFRLRERPERLGLISVGRLVEKKGLGDALQAVARLVGEGLALGYDIIGDGPLRDRLERQAQALGLAGVVRFHGALDQGRLPAWLDRADVLLAPSVTASDGDQEGIPNVLKEAMAAGLPVVSTRHSGIPELVEHGVTGLLAEEHDPAGLAGCLRRLIEEPGLWQPLTQAARERVERDYDIERQNDMLVELYREVARSG